MAVNRLSGTGFIILPGCQLIIYSNRQMCFLVGLRLLLPGTLSRLGLGCTDQELWLLGYSGPLDREQLVEGEGANKRNT